MARYYLLAKKGDAGFHASGGVPRASGSIQEQHFITRVRDSRPRAWLRAAAHDD
jgi:hypothetical protein